MAGELEIIDKVIAEHQIIRQNIQGVRSSMADFDALFGLQKAQAGWAQTSADKLREQKRQLQEAIRLVQEGLNRHFSYEEPAVRPLFGEAFMKALLFEHGKIRHQIEETISLLNASDLEGLKQADPLNKKSRLQEAVAAVYQLVEQHANLEEQMLRMLRRAFQDEAGSPKKEQAPG